MTLSTLSQVLQPALRHGYAIGGLVCLGWEDMRAYVAAAEAENAPVILQAGPGCRAHTPLPVLGAMFRNLAEHTSIPVVAHLDHGYTYEECREAIDSGFSSVMFDGSRKPVSENIEMTAKIVEMAETAGVSVEGEIGFVGYSEGESSAGTLPDEAARFAAQTGVDAMAISVGNVHLQQEKAAELDIEALRAIEAVTDVPLVIHGGSGVPVEMRSYLARESKVCKFNIGTELRMAFGKALRIAVNQDSERFDRVSILEETENPVQLAAQEVIRAFCAPAQC
ncbi:MAG: class II fructose-bisphosphate aldolase [Hyphomicrobiales bacterium]|nr:class II fructose-bisphosphate aldolase [Hyphomicrobiales bacterium]